MKMSNKANARKMIGFRFIYKIHSVQANIIVYNSLNDKNRQ